MNWLDLLLVLILAMALFKGFQRGFIIEVAALMALVGGIWIAARHGGRLGTLVGLEEDQQAIAFLLTFLAVLLVVHLVARLLTTLIDLALLGLPNKLAGAVFGVVRTAFVLSVMLNILLALSSGSMPSEDAREGSALHAPIRAFAPFVIPELGEQKWLTDALEQLTREAEQLLRTD
jgi:membrane protein required for colicin V production